MKVTIKIMKIILLIPSLDYGGAQTQLAALANGLHKSGRNVVALTLYPGGEKYHNLLAAGVPVFSMERRGRWDILPVMCRLVRFVYGQKPDVIHGYLLMANVLVVVLKLFIPQAKAVMGVRISESVSDQGSWTTKLMVGLEQKLSRFADLIIANSQAGKEESIARRFPEDRIMVIPNGIDWSVYDNDPLSGQAVRCEWGIDRTWTVIGCSARLDPMKDHLNLVRAAAIIARNNKNVRFVCVGEGPAEYKGHLIRQTDESGLNDTVMWVGRRNDMRAVYNAFDILVSASAYAEGFSNSIGEAMCCGVPCVVTDVGDSALIVGETGIVVPPKSPEELARGLEEMMTRLGKERDAIKAAARQRIVDEFSIEKLVLRTYEALNNTGLHK